MDNSPESIIEQVEGLIAASEQFEKQLAEADFSQAHYWMFNIREILYDLQRINKLLANLFDTADVNKTPLLLNNFVEDFLYTVVPHMQHHLNELEKEMENLLLESELQV